MVSDTTERRMEQVSEIRRAPALDAQRDTLEDSHIMTMFDGVCGTRSVEITRAGREPHAGGSESDQVIREREIGHVAEPMC